MKSDKETINRPLKLIVTFSSQPSVRVVFASSPFATSLKAVPCCRRPVIEPVIVEYSENNCSTEFMTSFSSFSKLTSFHISTVELSENFLLQSTLLMDLTYRRRL
ncbi:hypothetical protein AVEN_168756-1 [Araneus ventricosus]|uniref:Uncharacterized protein n=1 Tax=Araneus ventricosus TaxID=182803 RepID=A0A4Y2Q0M6_ARAVE|nr:hypothetical protein AVEN_256028-1 [Araneus ventricosus]GBN57738.1 hypothetical protein AVEN_86777-1 [Araneus ventricosus]GBN57756.1 hypothetical protein AVEN_151252-1 [Araneus ventricosus]GBN57761.1 hypothetical protein AVEN_168756-1 [Araneus ventricosus]